MTLRRVEPERPPLSRDALQKKGDALVSEARKAALDAVRRSMHSEFISVGKSISEADVWRWRGRARDSIAAWREVESITTELLVEIERVRKADVSRP